ncbi:DnaA regulatory inactivator HdaA [Paenochrobactrum glaciei]|uniref:DnaA regulatory inactivator HdaA n=1 Tax=Paenochrobactrum glaciei TaxID=486407 RepID=A0ABN1FH46_9HYPH
MSEARPRQLPFELKHQPGYERDNLIVAGSNRAAVDLVDRWPDWVAPVVILAGPTGSGKTHMAQVWQEKTGALLVDPSNISADIQERASIQPMLIEDIGDVTLDETGLFHLINSVRQHAAQGPGPSLLMTSRLWPAAWGVKLPDLASRLKAATVVEIAAPDDMLLTYVIHKLFADRQVDVEPYVVSYLVSRIERSLNAAIRVVDQLDRVALEQKSRITRILAAQVLNSPALADIVYSGEKEDGGTQASKI